MKKGYNNNKRQTRDNDTKVLYYHCTNKTTVINKIGCDKKTKERFIFNCLSLSRACYCVKNKAFFIFVKIKKKINLSLYEMCGLDFFGVT